MKFSATPEPLDLVAPLLGEHNREILVELGYEDARIDDLLAHGILVSGDR
jgi:crotonobetainyl-CoA:carnitine CoA-transferase CaiB-like acyl-CoA transferase